MASIWQDEPYEQHRPDQHAYLRVPERSGPIARMVISDAEAGRLHTARCRAVSLPWGRCTCLSSFLKPPAPVCAGCGLPADHPLNVFADPPGLTGPPSQRLCCWCNRLWIEAPPPAMSAARKDRPGRYWRVIRCMRVASAIALAIACLGGSVPAWVALVIPFIGAGPPYKP